MIEIKAPNNYLSEWAKNTSIPILFLAGSIEMGAAEMWQDRVAKILQNERVILLNPRRDDWDSSWQCTIDNLQFVQQVRWEQQGLLHSDVTEQEEREGSLETVFLNGVLTKFQTIEQIRAKVNEAVDKYLTTV